jgi:hypothetical protein
MLPIGDTNFGNGGASLSRITVTALVCLLGLGASSPLAAQGGLVPTPFNADLEFYSGGISGQTLGTAYRSIGGRHYGARFNIGILKVLNFSVGYLYSDQVRTLTASTSQGAAQLRSATLNSLYANTDFNLLHLPHATLYLSPGAGITRYARRRFDWITSMSGGSTSFPVQATTAPAVNLGMGMKIMASKHLGFSLDARDFLSGGGSVPQASGTTPCPGPTPNCLSGLFNVVPQNSLVFSLGLVFKVL